MRGFAAPTDHGWYSGRRPHDVEELTSDEVLRFMRERHSALPPIVATWVQTSLCASPELPGRASGSRHEGS